MYTPPGSPSLVHAITRHWSVTRAWGSKLTLVGRNVSWVCAQSEAKEKQLESLLFNRRSAGLKDIKHNAWCRKCTLRSLLSPPHSFPCPCVV